MANNTENHQYTGSGGSGIARSDNFLPFFLSEFPHTLATGSTSPSVRSVNIGDFLDRANGATKQIIAASTGQIDINPPPFDSTTTRPHSAKAAGGGYWW